MTRKRKAAIIVTSILIGLALIARPIWEGICGNASISFYGQVVDANGKGIPGVEVTFDISYSNKPAIPVPFGRVERERHETVTTDKLGNFSLDGVYGYSVRFAPAKYGGREWGFIPIKGTAGDDAGYGVSMDDRFSRAKLPDTPAKRVVYRLVKLQS